MGVIRIETGDGPSLKQWRQMMAKIDEVLAALGSVNADTNRIAAAMEGQGVSLTDVASDIEEMKTLLADAKGDAAAVDEALSGLSSIKEKVKAAADAAETQAAALKDVAAEYPEAPAPPPIDIPGGASAGVEESGPGARKRTK